MNSSLARAVQWALEAGYRHIDTATLYRVEDEVGQGVRAFMTSNNVNRRDVYVTTKVRIRLEMQFYEYIRLWTWNLDSTTVELLLNQ